MDVTIRPLFTFFSEVLSGVAQGSAVLAGVLTGVAAFAGYWAFYRLFLKKALDLVIGDYQKIADQLGDFLRFVERVDQSLSRLSPLLDRVENLNERLSQVERLYATLHEPTTHQLPTHPPNQPPVWKILRAHQGDAFGVRHTRRPSTT